MRSLKFILLFVMIGILSCSAFSKEKTKNKKPNLIIIIADQWRGSALGILGEEPVKTPNLDKLANSGVIFTNAVSNYPLCSPARAMLMSGKYPMSNGVVENCNSMFDGELKKDEVCWSDVLHNNGYSLGYIGKWHLDKPFKPYVDVSNNKGGIAWDEWCPPKRRHGFDYWLAYGTYDVHTRPMYWDNNSTRNSFFYVDEWGPEYEISKAIEFLKNKNGSLRNQNQPFALVVSMNPPHTPYNLVPEKYKNVYQDVEIDSLTKRPDIPPTGTEMGDYYRNNIKNYYACITGDDDQIGKLLRYLESNKLFDNTIIVFTADHGDCIGIHNWNHKNIFYEEAMRIPMIISYPEKLRPRVDTITQISIGDLYPTLVSILGLKKKLPKDIETINHSLDLLKNRPSKRGKYQPYFHINPKNNSIGLRGVRTLRYTYVVDYSNNIVKQRYLFDREKDPYELKNLAGDNPRIMKKMNNALIKILKAQNDVSVSATK